ncbi:hypothetical protein VNO78_13273 [Psophocarpus tetragonolobus]|uniref:Epidermal patterning factor-like protein n=1 Tax=Psophocarpus tetragonolobus TaxID=3891 RepID=A0AAN9SQZ2_PSOTE
MSNSSNVAPCVPRLHSSLTSVLSIMSLTPCYWGSAFAYVISNISAAKLQEERTAIRDKKEEVKEENMGMELYPTGSTIPDCSHACGPCFPCKRVMISFKCSIAESCPIVYRCTCKGKYYHVPSN